MGGWSVETRALHESRYMHRYLQVYPWENLYRQVTHVQVSVLAAHRYLYNPWLLVGLQALSQY